MCRFNKIAKIKKQKPNIMNITFNDLAFRPDFPIIVTAYTTTSHLGDYYKKAIPRLTKSCIKHDLQHVVFPLKGSSDWIKNCNLKPTVILHALKTFNRSVLWIDADAEIFKYPEIFENHDFDMALVSQAGHWLSGTLFFSVGSMKFVEKWKEMAARPNQSTPDEIILKDLYHNIESSIKPKLRSLPSEYNVVVHTETDTNKLVIGHYIRPDIAPSRNCKPVPLE